MLKVSADEMTFVNVNILQEVVYPSGKVMIYIHISVWTVNAG